MIKNKGEEVLTSVKIEVYLNNTLIQTINESSISLNKNESATINLDGVTAINGSNDYKVVLPLPNEGADENTSDNELEVQNSFAEGVLHNFYIDEDSKDPNLNWTIEESGVEVIFLSDVTPTVNSGKEEYAFCLAEGCYDIEVTEALTSGSCTVDPWSSSTVYTGGEIVSYGGRKYEAKWWTQNNQPDINNHWQDLGECISGSPTDVFGFKNAETSTTYFEVEAQNFNNPYTNDFCNGSSSYSFDFSAGGTSVANCTDAVYTATESNRNGTSFSWDFGAGATPATATGIGPHTVSYATTGQKTVSLDVDGTIEEKVNYIEVLQNTSIDATVDMTLTSGDNPSCDANETHEFTATGSNEGDNATYEWYVGTNVGQSGTSATFNWQSFSDGDEVRVVMTSSDPYVAQQEVTSSSIILVLDICTSVDETLAAQTNIYPNPVTNQLTIDYQGTESIQWEIMDINGKVISSGNLGSNENRVLDLSTYAKGSYLVRYTSGERSNIIHLVKK